MTKKVTRNRARDMVADYYKTNRQATKENEDKLKKNPGRKPWSRSEIMMLIAIGVCGVAIVIKYLVFR